MSKEEHAFLYFMVGGIVAGMLDEGYDDQTIADLTRACGHAVGIRTCEEVIQIGKDYAYDLIRKGLGLP